MRPCLSGKVILGESPFEASIPHAQGGQAVAGGSHSPRIAHFVGIAFWYLGYNTFFF